MALYILYSCPLSAGFQHALLLSGRCIPDVSLERDVLHIHLLLYHLLLSSFLKIILCIYLLLTALGLLCCMGFAAGEVHSLFIVVASLVEHGLQGVPARELCHRGPVAP